MQQMKIPTNNLALALGGGVARGAFHLGVLDFCEQHNIHIKAYSGSSIGAIISASHASGVKAKEQLKIFSSKELKQAIKFNYFRNGLLKIDHTNKIIKELLPIENIEDIPKPLWVSAYDLKKKELHYFNSGDTLTLCMASSALIPVFKPISYKEMLLIDGGLFDNIPIKPLENRGYDIYAVDLFAKNNLDNAIRALGVCITFSNSAALTTESSGSLFSSFQSTDVVCNSPLSINSTINPQPHFVFGLILISTE